MGGRAALRAAAKVAGIGVFNGGIRAGEHPVVTAARKATRPFTAAVSLSTSDDLKLAVSNDHDSKANCCAHKPFVEMSDWEFADVEDGVLVEAGESMPRLVFGGAPSIQEAKQATSELNCALEKTYLSPNTTSGLADSIEYDQEQELLFLSGSEHAVTKPCIVSEMTVTPSTPKHAIQAFRLLNESPDAQNVVTSIACDPNVWYAVMQNPALVGFLQSHKTDSSTDDPFVKQSDETSESESESVSEFGESFMDHMKNIKQKITTTVVAMMNKLSDTFESFFNGPVKGECHVINPDGTAGISLEKTTIGASLMGLAVMVIMVVALKRS